MQKTLTLSIALTLFSTAVSSQENEQTPIEKVEVIGQRNQAHTEPTLETEKMLQIAGIDGDPLAAVFSLPGVIYAGGDDGGEPAIRGSSPDDNAFYVDLMPAGYIFHLFGDSIFNKNLVRTFDLNAAAFGSEYGDAIGGVFDVKLRDPRNQPVEVTFDASLLKTGIMAEGSVTDNQAFYFSYRRSLIHLFYSEGDEEDGITVFDAPQSDDYQGKYQWLIGNDQKLTFTINGASDKGGINISAASEEGRIDPDFIGDASLNASFDSQGVQWEYFSEEDDYISVAFSHVSTENGEKYGAGQFVKLKNDQLNFRTLLQTRRFKNHQLSLGLDAQQNDFEYEFDTIPYFCTDHDTNCVDQKGERIQGADTIDATMLSVYLNDSWKLSSGFSIDIGIRADNDNYTDETFIHPRLGVNWIINPNLSVFARAGTYSRFPDVENALKIIGNPNLKPAESTHYSAGVEYEINADWRAKAEMYYKDISQLSRAFDIDDENADLRYSNDLSGKAHGIEWVVEKELSDNWYGWVSLSWSESERTDDITQVTTEYYLDTPWIINSVVNYQLNDHWNLGLRFTARSGAKHTPIIGIKPNPDFPDNFVAVYGKLNSDTLPTYSRLDLQAKYDYTLYGFDAAWTFAIINALNSDNISGYFFNPDGNETVEQFVIDQEEGIGLFPSIGFEVTF